jgi:hypothetical protein
MRRRLRELATLLVLAAVLVGLVVLLRGASDTFRKPRYDASAPTSAKLAKLAPWLPPGAEFFVAADVPRLLADPALHERLGVLVGGTTGVAAELASALLAHQEVVGLLAVAGNAGVAGSLPQIVLLAQGGFDEASLLAAVRTAMAAGRAGLVATDLGWTTLFAESDTRDPFGFLILDPEHLAVGDAATLAAFYAQRPTAAQPAASAMADRPIVGMLSIGPRLVPLIPPAVSLPQHIELAGDAEEVILGLRCRDEAQAKDLRMFLEGARSLLLLQQEMNLPLVAILKALAIGGEGDRVIVTGPTLPLLDLLAAVPH